MDDAVNQTHPATVDGRLARLGCGLWPARCLVCGERGADGRDLCRACARALPWNRCACPRCALPLAVPALACGRCLKRPPALDAVRAAFVYGTPLDRLLPRLKFHDDLAAGRLLAALMLDDLQRPAPAALIAVPLAHARLRERGYDQARELARPLARALGVPLIEGALRRTRDTPPQSSLGALARRRNLRGAFAAGFRGAAPTRVVLIDDVMTTGATLLAAAGALRRAGVARVEAWVCARVP
ncbi:double zinc ribbon domain-containing protein [Lysobacter sp. Root604]|uniref:double zinc ribbon domain-containing protein n=1 Tax=Lysobacter sp. Root604 TaxID=1736568 RepID=UPI0006F71875|nr:double zinc ribbon domain-containing protein [Lysobacter sp. Root604]KRA17126.1 competence protein ComF [Lysobacter sp. Root604]